MNILQLLKLYRGSEVSEVCYKQLSGFMSETHEQMANEYPQVKEVYDKLVAERETSYAIIKKLLLTHFPCSLEDVASFGSKGDLAWYCTRIMGEYVACPSLWVDVFCDSYLFVKDILCKKKNETSYFDFFKVSLLYLERASVCEMLGEKQQSMADRLAKDLLQKIKKLGEK